MIKKHYTGNARRALNIIWNAAGDYDYDPPFMAFYENGQADHYFNMVIGFVRKYFDAAKIEQFFECYDGAFGAGEFDEYLWLGIENCVYEKELPVRPILSALRKARAEEFFRVMPTLSKQQIEYSSVPVLNQKQARWAMVLGKRGPILGPKENKIFEALQFPGTLDTDGLLRTMHDFLLTYFKYDTDKPKAPSGRQVIMRAIASRVSRHEQQRRDVLFLRAGTGQGDRARSVSLEHFGSAGKYKLPDEEDRQYIENCFGSCTVDPHAMRIMENDLCKGNHAYTRLWFSEAGKFDNAGGALHGDGEASRDAQNELQGLKEYPNGSRSELQGSKKETNGSNRAAQENGMTEAATEQSKESRLTEEQADREARVQHAAGAQLPKTAEELYLKRRAQQQRNVTYARNSQRLINAEIRHLSGEIDTIFASFLQFMPDRASSGKILANEAWRLKVLGDTHVFEKPGDEAERNIALTLLLDASMSRVNTQEIIASEAYVIAKSLQDAKIPVQVAAFRSLRGYTSIEVLKGFSEKDCSRVFSFYAGGWNRDGLAIDAIGYLLREEAEKTGHKQLLLVLTDGNPNDSAPMPPVSAKMTRSGYGTFSTRSGNTFESRSDHGNNCAGQDGNTARDDKSDGSFFGLIGGGNREYQGPAAVQDTADSVKKLRDSGIRTAAIFLGATYHLESVHAIYGQDYVRIQKIAQLSDAVATLLLRELQKVDA